MEDKRKLFWLGIFIVGAIIVTAWLLLFLKPSVGDKKVTLHIRFSNIDKVITGTRVTFAGKPVGEVVEIKEIKDPRLAIPDEFGNIYFYELTLKVDSSVQVYTYDEIVFSSSGLLGEKSIAIIPKAAPPNAPPSQNVTEVVLYARSTDKIQETLNQLTQVTETFEEVMEGFNNFFDTNTEEVNHALKSLTFAADEVGVFAANANNTHLVEKITEIADSFTHSLAQANRLIDQAIDHQFIENLGKGFENIHRVTDQVTLGQGTLGYLINDNSLYIQLITLMCKFEMLINDISNYGLLFQYNKTWQRKRKAHQKCVPSCYMDIGDNPPTHQNEPSSSIS